MLKWQKKTFQKEEKYVLKQVKANIFHFKQNFLGK